MTSLSYATAIAHWDAHPWRPFPSRRRSPPLCAAQAPRRAASILSKGGACRPSKRRVICEGRQPSRSPSWRLLSPLMRLRDDVVDHWRTKFPARPSCSDAPPRRGRLMLERTKSVWRITVLYGIAVGLLLALPACGDFKKDFLCRPAGVCVNAPDGSPGYN
jgi:hypothetical protein